MCGVDVKEVNIKNVENLSIRRLKMYNKLNKLLNKPDLYALSTNRFWDDEHISKALLDAHLNPNLESASRKIEFIDKSVNWIASLAPPSSYPQLLDLGCGPGLYAERFSKLGYMVTGIDFSKRSVEYAKDKTITNNSGIDYKYQDYLMIDYKCCFDIITLIYCDFGVLSIEDRAILLSNAYKALKKDGKLILDVFTPNQHKGKDENSNWKYYSNGGFWDKNPNLCLNSFYRYDKNSTVLDQTIVITEHKIECYNIWEHCFTKNNLISEIQNVGFTNYDLYGDISGGEYVEQGSIICIVLTK